MEHPTSIPLLSVLHRLTPRRRRREHGGTFNTQGVQCILGRRQSRRCHHPAKSSSHPRLSRIFPGRITIGTCTIKPINSGICLNVAEHRDWCQPAIACRRLKPLVRRLGSGELSASKTQPSTLKGVLHANLCACSSRRVPRTAMSDRKRCDEQVSAGAHREKDVSRPRYIVNMKTKTERATGVTTGVMHMFVIWRDQHRLPASVRSTDGNAGAS